MNDIKTRRRQALLIATLVGLFCAVPVGYFIYLNVNHVRIEQGLGEVQPFALRDQSGKYVTLNDVREHVTVLAFFPKQTPLPEDLETLDRLSGWMAAQLMRDRKTDVQSLTLLTNALAFAHSDSRWRVLAEWRRANDLIPTQALRTGDILYIADRSGSLRGSLDLRVDHDMARFKKLASKLLLNRYLDHYLSRRTFMGPRRDLVEKESANDVGAPETVH